MDNKKDVIKTLVETGSDISGSISGAVIGGLIAGPLGLVIGGASGPIITTVFKKVGSEIQQRLLGPREEIRIGAAYGFAIHKLKSNLQKGLIIRNDSFFDNKDFQRPDSEEILEGIILGAQREYEERKVKYLGFLYANICTNGTISPEHANQLLKITNTISYRQFCILQLFRDRRPDRSGLDPKSNGWDGPKVEQGDLVVEVRDLQQKGLINITARLNTIDDNTIPIPVTDIVLSANGLTYCEMLSLEEIPETDLNNINKFFNLIKQ